MKASLKYILPTIIICFLISYLFFYFKEKTEFIKLSDDKYADCLVKVDKKTNQICIMSSRSCTGYFNNEQQKNVCEIN